MKRMAVTLVGLGLAACGGGGSDGLVLENVSLSDAPSITDVEDGFRAPESPQSYTPNPLSQRESGSSAP